MKKLLILCGTALALLLGLGVAPARAATWFVTSLADNGPGTLRQAMINAGQNAGADTITFQVSGTIALASALNTSGDLTIDGAGQSITLSGNDAVSVLEVFSGTLELRDLTIANGLGTANSSGGGVSAFSGATLRVIRCAFLNNSSAQGGGAIAAYDSAIDIADSRFVGNRVYLAGGRGGAISSNGNRTTITRSSFENNTASTGGALYLFPQWATPIIRDSTFQGNQATSAHGGAIASEWGGSIANSTFAGNTAADAGGAIAAEFNSGATLVVTNSTLSGNQSNALNLAGRDGAVFMGARHVVVLRNSIVASSTRCNCSPGVQDGGGNLSDDASCAFTATTSLNNTLPQLGPLQNNGGPTKTMAPITGSPAIDLGVNALAQDANGNALINDQRGTGFPRISPAGGTVDRGAFEVLPPPPTLLLTTCPAATAKVGLGYSSTLAATGGTPPNRFSITGSLPGGLLLDSNTGALGGTPTVAGTFNFTAVVTDSGTPTPQTNSKPCSIVVAPAVVVGGQLSVTPTELAFGTVTRRTARLNTVTLKNNGSTPVTIGKVSVTPSAGTSKWVFNALSLCPSSLAAGKRCTVGVAMYADDLGAKSATLNVPNGATGSPQSVALSANVVAGRP